MDNSHFEGLHALLASTFPKKCPCCGRLYPSVDAFFNETRDLAFGRPSLKSSQDDDGTPIVEVFRNCVCGSTLMDEFGCRRDDSASGHRRRSVFDELMALLISRNLGSDEARRLLLDAMHGDSEAFASLVKELNDRQ